MKNNCCNKYLGEELTLSATSMSILIAKKLTINELQLLSLYFTVMGDSLSLIATNRSIYEETCLKSEEILEQSANTQTNE